RKKVPIWRILTNFPNPLSALPSAKIKGEPIWVSSFQVSHRIAQRLSMGNIYLAGDAAHVHSPIGGRGMNLGIEDAWTFCHLFKLGRIDEYHSLRKKTDESVMHKVNFLSQVLIGEGNFFRLLHAFGLPNVIKFNSLNKVLTRTI